MSQRFRLAKVLEARRAVEDRRKQELADAERTLLRERAVLARLHEKAAAYRVQALQPPVGRLDIRREMALRAVLQQLVEAAGRQAGVVAQSATRVETRRATLLQAVRDRKVLEKLEEHARQAQRLESDAREQSDMDEIARQTFVRSSGRGARARTGRSDEETP